MKGEGGKGEGRKRGGRGREGGKRGGKGGVREGGRGKGEGRRGSIFFLSQFFASNFLWVPLGPKEDSFEQIIIF